MRKFLLMGAAAAVLGLGPVGCSTLTPSAPAETATYSRLVIDADAAFIAGATLLNELEGRGTVTGANRTKAEGLRVKAHEALLALRATAGVRRTPNPATFYAVMTEFNDFLKGLQ